MVFAPKTIGKTCAPPSPGRLHPQKQQTSVSVARNRSKKQGNSTKGSVHRDAREHYDVIGCEYQRIDWQLLPALCSDWPSDVTGCRLRSYVLYLLWSFLE
jgi:hypothetical protein